MLAEQSVAPEVLHLRKQGRGSSRTTARAHRRRWELPFKGWTGRTEGRRKCHLDRGEVVLVRPRPEERSRDERRHGVGAERRFLLLRLSAPRPLKGHEQSR